MAAFKFNKEINYKKSFDETMLDVQQAFARIGKVKKIDTKKGIIQGKTRYGLQSVKITVNVAAGQDKTVIKFNGKGDDVAGIGAEKGVENLIKTMQNLTDSEFVPSKTGGVTPLFVMASIIEVILFVIIVIGYRNNSMELGVLATLSIIWVILIVYLIVSRIKMNRKK